VPAAGEIDHFFDDEPVPGTHGVDLGLLKQVEPFPTKELVPYDTGYLSGHVVEHYQVVLVDAAQRARCVDGRQLMALCGAQVRGDTPEPPHRSRPRARPSTHPRADPLLTRSAEHVPGRRQQFHRVIAGATPRALEDLLRRAGECCSSS
jgi:hypothetical protein